MAVGHQAVLFRGVRCLYHPFVHHSVRSGSRLTLPPLITMDPVSIIVSALAAGALAGLKPTAEAAVKDAYAGLKALIQRKFARVDVTPVENKPESQAKRDSVAEDLKEAGADQDPEILDEATRLLELIEAHAPEAGEAIGVDLKKVKARAIELRDIVVRGQNTTGARLHDVEATEDIRISGVRAEGGGGRANP
jgi:hypothetical protein